MARVPLSGRFWGEMLIIPTGAGTTARRRRNVTTAL
jgi:hypothetical protein